jgi:adenine-specific DNA-methyltransferase
MSVFIRQSATMQKDLKADGGWVILSPIEASIKTKIEVAGTPLKDWDINIYRGILTGYNEAFIINQKTRDKLIEASSKNAEIIRPIILGKNIKRYNYSWDNLWIINSHNGVKGKYKRIDIENDYPTIFEHLKQFLPQIEIRSDQGENWTNLRNCAYLDDFDKPKIAWGNLSLKCQFAYIKEPMMINAPSPFFTTDKIYLLAILNSHVADFYIKNLGVTRNGGYFEYKPMFVEQFPIPSLSKDAQVYLTNLINRLEESNLDSYDKEAVEVEIEQFVYKLYNLENEEISIIKKDN